MKILQIIGTLDTKYGGPVVALRDTIKIINEMGHSCEVVTLDAPNDPWLRDCQTPYHALGPSLGKYRYTSLLLPWLTRESRSYDAIIIHGIWQYPTLATWIASQKVSFPYYVYVHGALNPWFKHQYPLKHIKKWIYWLLAEYWVLRTARYVIFTSEEERRLASQSFWLYKVNGRIVPYGIVAPPQEANQQLESFYQAYPMLKDKTFLLYLGRIHLMKGIDLLLRAFAELSSHNQDLMLVVAGQCSGSYFESLKGMAQALGISKKIVWTGFINGNVKWGALRAANAFVLASHAENFGVTVAESLACGTPVLISNKVNIWREIISSGAGLVAPDTLVGTLTMLNKWFELGIEGQANLRNNAVPCFNNNFEISASLDELIRTISKA